jgi:hypothetical protein
MRCLRKEALKQLAVLVITKEDAVVVNVVKYHQPLPAPQV